MLNIPENIKALFRADNRTLATQKQFRLKFYDEKIDSLYPYEQLYPDEGLYPSEYGEPWLVIENDQIETESLQITESLSSDEDMTFGSCEGAEMQITVVGVNQDLTNKEFTLTVEIGGYEMALGMYTVKSFERQSDRSKRKITAYDRMQWFYVDVADWYNNLTFPMTIKAFRDALCAYIGVTQITATLPLDSMQISKTIEPETLQGIDVLKAICEINGCFGHIDKTGQLVYVQLQQTGLYPAEDLYPEETLYPSEFGGDGMPTETVSTYKQPMIYEDYLVRSIDSLTIRQEEGDIGASVGNGDNTYVIEGNFLVYGKTSTELLEIGNSILPLIAGRTYRPANIDCNAMPWVEVGDAIIAPTKDDVVETFVMKRTTKGCQSMRDTIEATGNETRSKQVTIHQQVVQLEGKTATIIKNVDEVSATVTDLKTYTEAQIQLLSDQITLKVSIGDVTNQLNSELTITGNSIALTTGHFTVNSKNLTVDSQGNATFSGALSAATGTFKGSLSAASGTFQGQITGGSINIKNKFIVDSNGNLEAKDGKFSGDITGSSITGSTIEIGPFAAYDDEVSLGDYYVSANGSNVFASNDGSVSIQTAEGGPYGSYAVLMLDGGSTYTQITDMNIETTGVVYAADFKPEDYDHTVTYWIDWLYDEVIALGGG